MDDTSTSWWPYEYCMDCGVRGVSFKHIGSLLPNGASIGRFCALCFAVRGREERQGKPMRPFGVEYMCSGCKGISLEEHRCYGVLCECPACVSPEHTIVPVRALAVVTEHSTYRFSERDGRFVRMVTRDGMPLEFSRCQIVWLETGTDMLLRCFGVPPDEDRYFRTLPVIRIEEASVVSDVVV
ncbi:MAG: hypothetical protein Q7S84_02700 [bacterium]|nr:hypothetical protein [bacterium]